MVFMRAVRVPGRDRLGNGRRCAPSSAKMAYMSGKDGAHPGMGLLRIMVFVYYGIFIIFVEKR